MKLAASKGVLSFAKSRSGRRPISVDNLLKKEKDSSIFKLSAYGDTEPLWQDQGVGRVDYESKVPVKLNPRVGSPDNRSGDVPSSNVSGIGVRNEDGRSNAMTLSLGTQSTGDIVPDAMPSSYKLGSATLESFSLELMKMSGMTEDEAKHTLETLDALEKNRLSPEQIARYSAIGAVAGPAVGALSSVVKGRKFGTGPGEHFSGAKGLPGIARHIAGDAIAGAITSGGIPIVRSALDRSAAKSRLQKWMEENPYPSPLQQETPKVAGFLQSAMSHLPRESTEHLTDVGGLGLMALGSGSHLYSQLRGQGDEGGPLHPTVQSGLDLAGLGAMAAPTIAALSPLARGVSHPLAGGGSKAVNIANLVGLGALAIPTADKIQARLRSAKGEDPEHKMLLGDKAHRALELAGYGTLAAPVAHRLAKDKGGLGDLSQLAGYATLAAPQVVPFEGPARTASELVGLGLLGAPAAAHIVHKG